MGRDSSGRVAGGDSMPVAMKDVYWLAGFLEGEGSFPSRAPFANTARIAVDTTDRDVAERAASLLGGRVCVRAPNNRTHYRPVYIVRVGRAQAIGWMMTLYPL